MELLVTRFSSGVEATLGIMHEVIGVDRRFMCYILEDQFNEPKVPGETRIPEGRYQIKLRTEGGMTQRYGDRFQFHRGMLWLQDVPDFEWIYIHVGNKDDHSEGCLLVGDGQVSNVTERGMVTNSVAAYTRIYNQIVTALMSGEEVWIEIDDLG